LKITHGFSSLRKKLKLFSALFGMNIKAAHDYEKIRLLSSRVSSVSMVYATILSFSACGLSAVAFSAILYAGAAVNTRELKKLEGICTDGPVLILSARTSEARLTLADQGMVRYALKKVYRNGAASGDPLGDNPPGGTPTRCVRVRRPSGLGSERAIFMAKPAARVPRLRTNLYGTRG